MEFRKSNRHLKQQPKPDQSLSDNPATEPSTRAKNARRFKARVRRILFKKQTIIILSAVIVIVVAGLLIRHYTSRNAPEYRTVLPDGKSAVELGGWTRISPPGKDPVFAYEDKINDVPISVSQQPLPETFRADIAGHIAELAKGYNATTKISAGDTTVYIGTSSKGPQSVILTKRNLLILIKSQKTIDNTAWEEYVKSLDGSGSGPKY